MMTSFKLVMLNKKQMKLIPKLKRKINKRKYNKNLNMNGNRKRIFTDN